MSAIYKHHRYRLHATVAVASESPPGSEGDDCDGETEMR
jgi:hypothetical protein